MSNTMNEPKLSVIMGVYNSRDRDELIRSIKSIQNQSFTNWQCIICDDGSEDKTYEFLTQYTRNDSRFIFVRNEANRGLGYSLNRALDRVTTPYVVRQDADDYSREDRFNKLYAYMEGHPEIDVLGTGMIMFDDCGEWGNYKIRTTHVYKKDFLIGTVVAHPSVIMRTKSIKACGGYRVARETRRCEDYDLFMRMYAAGYNICNIEDKLYYYKSNRNGNKRKFKNVFNESVVRFKGFKTLKMGIRGYPYILKPFVLYFMPSYLKNKIRKA